MLATVAVLAAGGVLAWETWQHRLRLTIRGLGCNDCRRPHKWKASTAQGKLDCARCHGYRPPESFIVGNTESSLAPFQITTHVARPNH